MCQYVVLLKVLYYTPPYIQGHEIAKYRRLRRYFCGKKSDCVPYKKVLS